MQAPISSRGENHKMPAITITFEHQQAETPKYTFGDRLAVKDDCAPKDWLTGEVVGMVLETEIFSPCWWYSIKLDAPHGLTEEYLEDDVIRLTEIARLQAEWELLEANPMQESNYSSLPKFEPGMQVKLNAASGFNRFNNLLKDFAFVVSSKYVSNEHWSGWVYKLTSENLTSPIEIGEIWLELSTIHHQCQAIEQPLASE